MFDNAIALSQRLGKRLVVFDLEHTGGKKDNRAITDFGALVVHPEGEVRSYNSLVKPPAHISFEPYVCHLTGIWPATVKNAPGWDRLMNDFVLPHKDAVWVGFNSRACDVPMVRAECLRHGVDLGCLLQLDLMRLGNVPGKLAARVAALVPDFDTSGAHRAAKDALMTLALLNAQVSDITEGFLQDQGILPRPKKPKQRKKKEIPEATVDAAAMAEFLVPPGVVRRGKPWTPAESTWVASTFRAGKSVDDLAAAVGRSALAIACALDKVSLLPDELRAQYRLA